MILRAKTTSLFEGNPLTGKQQKNTDLNIIEMENNQTVLESYPRRLVFELTNACNLNCVMCGRNASTFTPTVFRMDWFHSLEPLYDTVEEVTLMGWGEPTIHPHFVEMLKILDQHSARKYFCTNGMSLPRITEAIFQYHVDVFAISVDGAKPETNNRIRRGSDLNTIKDSLRTIVKMKRENNLQYPYMNFVFCAMKSNLHELPDLIRTASDIGLEEVKVVFLTAFDERMLTESLWDCQDEVQEVFNEAEYLSNQTGIALKLPHIAGTDPAGDKHHKDCFVAWRDFFLGSDGFIRPCMSTPDKFLTFDRKQDFSTLWNSIPFQKHRQYVNDPNQMPLSCRNCYQSSHCNWNRRKAHIQVGEAFSPQWERESKPKKVSSIT